MLSGYTPVNIIVKSKIVLKVLGENALKYNSLQAENMLLASSSHGRPPENLRGKTAANCFILVTVPPALFFKASNA